jgi:hypothetical protein
VPCQQECRRAESLNDGQKYKEKEEEKGQWEAKISGGGWWDFSSVFDWATLFCRVCYFLLFGPVVRGGGGSQVSEKED